MGVIGICREINGIHVRRTIHSRRHRSEYPSVPGIATTKKLLSEEKAVFLEIVVIYLETVDCTFECHFCPMKINIGLLVFQASFGTFFRLAGALHINV